MVIILMEIVKILTALLDMTVHSVLVSTAVSV